MSTRVTTIVSVLGSVLIATACLACSSSSSNTPAPTGELANTTVSNAPAASAEPAGTVLGHVEFQDHRVTIYKGADGPRYTLADGSGQALGQDLTREQFADRFPALFEAFEQARAGTLDASGGEMHEPPGPDLR